MSKSWIPQSHSPIYGVNQIDALWQVIVILLQKLRNMQPIEEWLRDKNQLIEWLRQSAMKE